MEDGITHYTSLSVTKILILKKKSLFRLSEGAFLNDTSEGRELFDFLSINFPTQKDHDTIAKPFAQKPFIGSFVTKKKNDDLTLWRMYGKEEKEEAKGCAITIQMEKLLENLKNKLIPDTKMSSTSKTDKDKLIPEMKTSSTSKTDEEFSFYRVAYRKEGDEEDQFIIPDANKEQEKTFNENMKALFVKVKEYKSKRRKPSDKQNLVELLNEITYLFKSAEYQYEHEIRLVIKGTGFKKVVDEEFHPPRVYIELVSIRPLIQQITLGPKVERADEWASAFYYSLDSEGYRPDILISHLPFK